MFKGRREPVGSPSRRDDAVESGRVFPTSPPVFLPSESRVFIVYMWALFLRPSNS